MTKMNGIGLRRGVMVVFCVILLGGATEFSARGESVSVSISPSEIERDPTIIIKTPIKITASGFLPGEDVSVEMLGIGKDNSDIGVVYGTANDSGIMIAQMETGTKIISLLRAPWDGMTPVIGKSEVLPVGVYKIRAVGFESKKTATCSFALIEPKKMK